MIKNIVSVTAALLGTGALVSACNFDQPSAGCITQDSTNWIAKYDLKEGQTVPEGCLEAPTGELLGVFKFTDPTQPGEAKLTIRPAGLVSRSPRDPGDPSNQTAVGNLADEPDAQDFCTATDFSDATVNAAESGTTAATNITYAFENVKVYAAPKAPGTQLTGDLTYTRDGCTLEYTVRAIWPATPCDPNSTSPADKCGEGSGINPEFAVECDASVRISSAPGFTGTCVPSGPIPAFKSE